MSCILSVTQKIKEMFSERPKFVIVHGIFMIKYLFLKVFMFAYQKTVLFRVTVQKIF